MKKKNLVFVFCLLAGFSVAFAQNSTGFKPSTIPVRDGVAATFPGANPVASANNTGSYASSTPIDKDSPQYADMIYKMRESVQRIASEYGNPAFAQVFTNDKDRAEEIRNKLKVLESHEALAQINEALSKRESELRMEIERLEARLNDLKYRVNEAQKLLDGTK